ncbi:MAG: hypothetical protein ABH877_04215 [bacterium]
MPSTGEVTTEPFALTATEFCFPRDETTDLRLGVKCCRQCTEDLAGREAKACDQVGGEESLLEFVGWAGVIGGGVVVAAISIVAGILIGNEIRQPAK